MMAKKTSGGMKAKRITGDVITYIFLSVVCVDVIERAIEALRPYEVASMRSAAKVRDQIAKKGFDKNLVKEYNNAVTENAPLREEVVRQVMNR